MGESQRSGSRSLDSWWWRSQLGVLAVMALLTAAPSHAVITTDGSLGPGSPTGLVPSGFDANGVYADYLITPELGKLAGKNLFQSFSEFDIESTKVATFTIFDQVEVTRIIGRVTGGSQASIAGTLRSTIDGADLYLLSPFGIAVSDGAVLDVPGSIFLSTANALRFDNGESFFADPLDARTVLSVANPSAFGFTSGAPASIVVGLSQMGAYAVPEGKILSFVGGDVAINGFGGNTDTINSPGSSVQIASAASVIDIPIDPIEFRDFDPSDLEAGRLGRVAISGADIVVDGTSEFAGSIVIRGENFLLNGGSEITSFEPSPNDASGAIDIRVRGLLELGDGRLYTRTDSAENGVGIYLAGDEVTLSDTDVWSGSRGEGRGGDIEIAARLIDVDSGSWLRSFATKAGAGSDINLTGPEGSAAEQIAISGAGTRVSSKTFLNGPGGSIRINAVDVAVVDDASILSETTNDGPGGAVAIDADHLAIISGGQILSKASGSGRGEDAKPGGTIALGSAERPIASIEIADGGLVSSETSKLAGGDVEIHAGTLTIRDGQIQSIATSAGIGGAIMLGSEGNPIAEIEIVDGGTVASGNRGSEAGGDIIVNADHLRVHNTGPANETFVFSETKFDNGGAGGAIEIRAFQVDLEDGGQIFTITEGTGQGGALSLIDVDTLRVSGEQPKPDGDESAPLKASLAARVGTDGKGAGGGLSIDARVVEVLNGGEIASRTFGKGDSAPEGVNAIDITATERITVQGGENGASQISATSDSLMGQEEKAGGAAGDIVIRTALLEIVDGGHVTASTTTSGEAGNVTITADKVALSGVDPTFGNPSGIFAQSITSSSGRPGSIRITASDSVRLTDALIFAQSAGLEDAGDIEIDAGRLFESTNSVLATSALQAAGGDIRVAATDLVYLLDSNFTTDVFGGAGGGGNVVIDPQFTVLNRSHITARAVEGDGGNITINTDFYFESGGSGLDASSNFGNAGEIQTTVPDTDLSGTLAALPGSFLDASALLARGCGAQTARIGSFVVESGGVIEPPPDAILRATDVGLSGAEEACSP